MDGEAIDRLARFRGASISRRTALGGLVALAGLRSGAEAKKRRGKKRKCRQPNSACGKNGCCAPNQSCTAGACLVDECPFTKTKTLWTQQADCTITRSIVIRDGVTLEGNGKTIAMRGPIAGFEGAGLVARGVRATVRNVHLDGAQVTGECNLNNAFGILFNNANGRIEDSVIEAFAFGTLCGGGVAVTGETGESVDIDSVTVRNAALGIDYVGNRDDPAARDVQGTISGCTVEGAELGFSIQRGANVTAKGNEITTNAGGVGMLIAGSTVDISDDNRVQGARTAVDITAATATVSGNTLTGAAQTGNGVLLTGAGSYDVSGNTISDFACGISLGDTVEGATIGTNSFPDPPGNAIDFCGGA